MASILAIVSKKVFDKECPGARPGVVFATDAYASTHKSLDALAGGGAIFLATVRPPDEKLWLVGILEAPKKSSDGWKAAKNKVAIADISVLRSKIQFANGSGITDKKGALGMSLQTPRTLSADDERLLRGAVGSSIAAPAAASVPAPVAVSAAVSVPASIPVTISVAVSAPKPDGVLFFSDEARKYLRPRTAADLAFDTAAGKQRRAKTAEKVAAAGGFPAAIEAIGTSARPPYDPRNVGNLLLTEPDSVRKAAMAVAERLWPDASPTQRAALLDCFPHRAEWAVDVATAWKQNKIRTDMRELLLPTLEDPVLLMEVVRKQGIMSAVVNVAATLREKSVPVLSEMLDFARYPNEEKSVSRALGCVGTPEAAATFTKNLRRQNVRPYATEFFARFPHLAKDALSDLAAKKTQIAGVARDILARLDRAQAVATTSAPGEEASMDEVPSILRTPPWEMKTVVKRKPLVVSGLAVPEGPSRLHWTERARRRWVAEHFGRCGWVKSDKEIAELKKAVAKKGKSYLYGNFPPDLVIPLLTEAPENIHVWNETPMEALALYGDRAFEAILQRFARKDVDCAATELLQLESPRVAFSLARNQLSKEWNRHEALLWIERYPETAVLGLVPVAVGDDEDTREGGELGLRHLARLGHRDLVLSTAKKKFGAAAADAVTEILDWDERQDGPKKPPKMPPGYRPAELRPPRLKNGKVLPRKPMENLDMLLRASALDYPLAGFDEVRDACDARSLAEHAWDLAKAWDIDSAKESQLWMLHAVAHFGDDEVVRRLTPALKGEGIASMLGYIGTDAALMELVTILVRVTQSKAKKRPKYAWGTEAAIDLIAARRGMNVDALEDQFVPTCDVDEEGGISLDLGERQFRVTFDHQLARILLDDKGERVKTLPRTGVDADKLAAATTLLTDLDEDVSAIASMRAASLERAMNDGRSWSLDDFRAVWVDHPLMVHMARGVVWEARAKDGRRLLNFRVAEDRSFANRDDEQINLPKEAVSIGVAHPARFSAEERNGWRNVFGDYKLLQPFEQLAREPPKLAPKLAAGPGLQKPYKEKDDDADVLDERLGRSGWSEDSPYYALPFEDGTFGVLKVESDHVIVSPVRDGRNVKLAEVDDVVRCELVRALDMAVDERG